MIFWRWSTIFNRRQTRVTIFSCKLDSFATKTKNLLSLLLLLNNKVLLLSFTWEVKYAFPHFLINLSKTFQQWNVISNGGQLKLLVFNFKLTVLLHRLKLANIFLLLLLLFIFKVKFNVFLFFILINHEKTNWYFGNGVQYLIGDKPELWFSTVS